MSIGLDGIVVSETVLSHSDASRPQLWLRGLSLDEVVQKLGYEGTVALLWSGFAGDSLAREDVADRLGVARRAAFEHLDSWLPQIGDRPSIDAARLCLAAMTGTDGAFDIVAALTVGVSAMIRAKRRLPPIRPDTARSTAEDFLVMINGDSVSPALVRALDTYLTVTAENGLGPSTFTARITASTGASLASAVEAAYCAFLGPLHGGAPSDVIGMLESAKESGDVDAWLDSQLAGGRRLVGFGNRAFPLGDPRADLLAEALKDAVGNDGRLAFAVDFQRRASDALVRHKPGRNLKPNLELNAALLLDACGIPQEAFTPTFAIARAVGWLAHAMEQKQTGRMIRPTSRYVGPPLPV
jgi:citrate synthase